MRQFGPEGSDFMMARLYDGRHFLGTKTSET